jgi:hypothetical protein
MEWVVDPQGQIVGLYTEALDLSCLGKLAIRRASFVEPDGASQWWADLAPLEGPRLGPFAQRSQALQAEQDWINSVWLDHRPGKPLFSSAGP